MSNIKYLATVACIVLLSKSALAQDSITSADGLAGCAVLTQNRPPHDSKEALYEGLCLGVLTTVWNIQTSYHTFNFCIPDGVNYGQAIAVVTAFGNTHPIPAQLDFAGLVAGVLEKTWPCKH
jgi:hypothetical protein